MGQILDFGRITRSLAVGAFGVAAIALVLTGAGCGDDDDEPTFGQCKAQFEVSAGTCSGLRDLLKCQQRVWSPPNNCQLGSCDCATGLGCTYRFTNVTQADCGGIWFSFACQGQTWTQTSPDVPPKGNCEVTQCLCFTPPPTPTVTRTPTPVRTPSPR